MASSWTRLLSRPRDVFSYVMGWSAPVRRGICCKRHRHPVLEIVYHRRGSGVTRLSGGRQVRFAEGDAILYAPGEEHDQVMDGPGEDLCIHLALPKRVKISGCLRIEAVTQAWLVADLEHLAAAPPLSRRESSAALHHRASSLLLSLVELDQRHHSPRSPGERHVEKAEHFIAENFQTIACLEEVSRHVGLSHDHLRHLFKSQKGVSLIRFLTEVRMRRAKSLLRHSRLPLKQIATLCGYRDEYYFSAAFRRLHHSSPGAAR